MNALDIERLSAELDTARAELLEHQSSWHYAFAMGAMNQGGSQHPWHVATRRRTCELIRRVKDLTAKVQEWSA
jgi:hypothetical protein